MARIITQFPAAACLAITTLIQPAFAQLQIYDKKIPGIGTEYSDRAFGVSFQLPPKWSLSNVSRWPDSGEPATTLQIRDPQTGSFPDSSISLYYRLFNNGHEISADEADQLLLAWVDAKVSQRVREGFRDYHVRANSYQPSEINGRRALSFIADYSSGKREMVEWLVRVRTGRVIAEFFIRLRAAQLDGFREHFAPILQTIRIP
jgi:hypothetical protein